MSRDSMNYCIMVTYRAHFGQLTNDVRDKGLYFRLINFMNFYELECCIVIGLQIQDHEADMSYQHERLYFGDVG